MQSYWSPVTVLLLVALTAAALLAEEFLHAEAQKNLFFQLATRDGLTNLYSIRHFRVLMNQLIYEAVLKKSPLSLILVDLDHFKRINDTYGHPAGDEVLRKAAQSILAVVRQRRPLEDIDFVARYGGEEFMVLVRHCDMEMSMDVAERIRYALENTSIEYEGKLIPVTASLGVATLSPGENIPNPMVHRADKALYLAKQTGRNRVCTENQI